MERISLKQARRLALVRAGLLKPEWTGLPRRPGGNGRRAERAALEIIRRFGYLQLDTVSIAGARSHAIVLLSRLDGFNPRQGEELLRPGGSLFEYWGHEASWIPLELYPAFEFRRQEFRHHPWWGDVAGAHPAIAEELCRRIREEGPLRTLDMEGSGGAGWWNLKLTKRVASALWSSGELAIRERTRFQRTYDLTERVIPTSIRQRPLAREDAIQTLLLKALEGHGWATTATLAATWRLSRGRHNLPAALSALREKGLICACGLQTASGAAVPGWIRPADLELAARLEALRPRRDRGVLLSPFDPLLWDRSRVGVLFDFDMILEIFKPAPKRLYGYYCLPILAGDRLIGRFDFKADRKQGDLQVLSCRFETSGGPAPASAAEGEAAWTALSRYAEAVGLKPLGWRHPVPR